MPCFFLNFLKSYVMRKCLLLVVLLLACTYTFAQLNLQYNFTRPTGAQGEYIKTMHGLAVSYDFRIKGSAFSIGPELGVNIYGLKTLQQELPFDNGYITRTDVNYTTSMNTYAAVLKFQPATGKNLQPYMALKAGALHYHSNMTIEDPEDPLGCEALERKALVKDITWMASAGAGFRLDGKAFSGKESMLALDFGVFYTRGGEAEYLKMTSDHNHAAMDPKSRMYYVRFQHLPTGDIHEHAIGTIYKTTSQMLEFRLGVQVKLDGFKCGTKKQCTAK